MILQIGRLIIFNLVYYKRIYLILKFDTCVTTVVYMHLTTTMTANYVYNADRQSPAVNIVDVQLKLDENCIQKFYDWRSD